MTDADLPRRPFLGLHVKLHDGGLRVASVLADSAAARAKVREGDRLVAIDDDAIIDAIHLLAIARSRPSRNIVFHVEREGQALRLEGVAPPLPIETSESSRVELGAIEVDGHRLRTIVNVPRSTPGPHPAIVYLQGLRARSCEYPLDPDAPLRSLVDGWTRAGLLVLRVERGGVGDSEGPPCTQTGLDFELDTYLAGIDHLAARADVDASRIFLFGQSLGAMTAPLIAIERDVAGIIAFGASAARWADCVVGTTRRQLLLKSSDAAGVEATVALWIEMNTLVCREGWTPERAFEQRPHLRTLRSLDCVGETMSGRHVSLYQELDAIDLMSVWREIGATKTRVLVLRGEYDWICTREEGEAIVRATGGNARFLELEKTGHDWLAYETFQKSRQWGEGRFDGGVVRATQTFTSPQPSGKTHP